MESIFDILDKGGPILYLLCGLSVFALAIILMKTLEIVRARLSAQKLIRSVFDTLESGGPREVRALLQDSPKTVASAPLLTVVECFFDDCLCDSDLQAEVSRVGSREIRSLESWLRGLSTTAQMSPLLGLLGTVLGMISAFMQFQGTSEANAALLAGGIWEALITTACGLAIAIPAMSAFYFLEGRIDQLTARVSDASRELLMQLKRLKRKRADLFQLPATSAAAA